MKFLKYMGIFALALASLLTLGCDLFSDDDGVSVEDRINAFEQDLNTRNFNAISDNFHSEMQSGQQASWDGIYADGIFAESNAPFEFDEPSNVVAGASNTKTAFGDYSNSIDPDQSYTFIMKEESAGDGNWKIKEFYIESIPIFRLIE